MIWREKRLLLIILGILLAANTVFFFTYRVQYENRLSALDSRLEEVKGQLASTRASRVAVSQQLAGYRKTQKDVKEIYDVRWSTQERRLTALIAEVQRLGRAANLVPKVFAFTRSKTAATPGMKAPSDAIEAGITFSVDGTYQQVRRLINLMELSDQFLIVDSISLSSITGDTVSINVHVKTLFSETSAAPGATNKDL